MPIGFTLSARLALALALGIALAPPALAQPAGPKVDATRIVSAQSGLFSPPGNEAHLFSPAANLPLRFGQAFGWRMTLQTAKKRVLVREELTAPAEPKTWGDPEPDVKQKTSPDGRTVTTEWWAEVKDGVIFHSWSVTDGDPKGTWVFRVFVDGLPERVLRLEAR
jgi:hypothetical protein